MSDSEDEYPDDNRKLELEYNKQGNNQNNGLELVKKAESDTMPPAVDNKKQTDCAENKKNCPNTTTTTTNNGVIKVSMVGEIAMSNFHNHQCK